jgi:hypothetical protein
LPAAKKRLAPEMTKIRGIIQMTAARFHTSNQPYIVAFLTCQSSRLKKRVV